MLAQFEAQVESLKEAARSELTAAMSDAEREHSALTEQFEAAQQNLKQNHKQISAVRIYLVRILCLEIRKSLSGCRFNYRRS